MRNVFIYAALGLGLAATTAMAQAPGRISVSVSGLHSDNGVVRCGLYASADTFRKPGREVRGVVARPNGQRATCVFSGITAGSYAVAVFHAEYITGSCEWSMGHLLGRCERTSVGWDLSPCRSSGLRHELVWSSFGVITHSSATL